MNSPKYEDKQCNVCGRVFHPTHGRQKMCLQCREYFDAGKFMRTSNAVDTVSSEAEIRRRFIEKEENCSRRRVRRETDSEHTQEGSAN